ncbi:VanZ family protein [Paenibacillus sp. Soil522]|uniref:VanZ family protein n=1 Tax=Paenibacillus sp. Soil522 TaxID=1736388 RepID=UPI0006FAB7F3|nr:VanZ family protein [Paenibacillus sp. Soil522]KRE24945.1 hypothetical protein ASG81_28040 [Paenibacillus sp. Soil522]
MMELLKRVNAKHVFIVYLIGIVNFVIVKYFGDMQIVLDRIESNKSQRDEGYWNISLVPFRSITSSIESYFRIGLEVSSINLIANVILFIPMGLLIPFLMRNPSFLKRMGVTLEATSILREVNY